MKNPSLRAEIRDLLDRGVVIPAHPLAVTRERKLDPVRQSMLTRYYIEAGTGGIAVGVHTTQFAIRQFGMYGEVLQIAAETARDHADRPFALVAGVVGETEPAIAEARVAVSLGYDLALVSLGGLGDWSDDAMVEHVRQISAVIPVMGFYLQPSVGGRPLGYRFWRSLAEIEGVVAIKMAPFNRYATIDVVRGVAESSRRDEIALYTGNDDNILPDLLTTYRFTVNGQPVEKRIVGGLLGHWAVWTSEAVRQLDACHVAVADRDGGAIEELLATGIAVSDSNAAFFDVQNQFRGSIAGIHEVLQRQGLLEGIWCLDPEETLSPGQLEEIDRVYRAYPDLNDDDFVASRRNVWFADATARWGR